MTTTPPPDITASKDQQSQEIARKKARELSSQGINRLLLRDHFEELGLKMDNGWAISVQQLYVWCHDIEYEDQKRFPNLSRQQAQEKARELRSQGFSFSRIQYYLKNYRVGSPAVSTLATWCRGLKVDRSLFKEKAREQQEVAQEKARELRSQGLSLSLILRVLETFGFNTTDGTIPTLETLSVWCRDVEVDTLSPYSSPSSPPDITAQEKARELRSQGLSLSLIRDRLKELGLKTSRGTHPTLKTLFVWCRDIEVKELKRKKSSHKGGRQRLEDMPQHKGLAPLIKRERLDGKSFDQIAALVAEKGYRTAGDKQITKTQLIRIWKRISDD